MVLERLRYVVGFVTLAAALTGGVYLYSLLGADDTSDYFHLNVEWRNARGLKPGGDVKCRGVVVGSVRAVSLSEDGAKAVVGVMMSPSRKDLVRTNSRFWIVTPRFAGLTGGATGLETLVRDSYVEFRSPEPLGSPMASGGSLLGMERPFLDDSDAPVPPIRRGDLVMHLLAAENHGLLVSSAVMFRGMQTGDVRDVALSPERDHVVIELRIDRSFRETVTDKTRFWIARPRLSGALLQGFAVEDVGALLSPFIAYHTPAEGGLPVPDGYRIAAEPERPALTMGKVQAERSPVAIVPPQSVPSGLTLVRIVYEAVEDDWFSPDDEVRRTGTGVLIEDREGRLLVLTARSLVDANYFLRDTFDTAPDVVREGISVMLPDGGIQRALRAWVSPDGADLAVVSLELRDGSVGATGPAQFVFGEAVAPQSLQALDDQRQPRESVAVGDNLTLPGLDDYRGAVALHDGRIVGLLGQRSGTDATTTIVPIQQLPEPLRPR